MGEMVCDPNSCFFFFFVLFFFFLYHAFIVSRYKKLRAALAMEKTKPIKHTRKKQKKPKAKIHHYVGALANRLPKPYK